MPIGGLDADWESEVTVIPVPAFHDEPGALKHYARLAFRTRPEALDEALARLKRYFRNE